MEELPFENNQNTGLLQVVERLEQAVEKLIIDNQELKKNLQKKTIQLQQKEESLEQYYKEKLKNSEDLHQKVEGKVADLIAKLQDNLSVETQKDL